MDLKIPELRLLRSFVVVVEELHFTRATRPLLREAASDLSQLGPFALGAE